MTLADHTYRAVQSAITDGSLAAGEKITERGLAERFSVSPTPIREALRRLEQDGLIERAGPRTVVVATLGANAVDELAEVEVALRGLIARFAARHATPAQLDQLDSILDEADDLMIVMRQRHAEGQPVERYLGTLLDAFQRFNDAVSACAGNPVLVRLLEQSRVFSRDERRSRLTEHVLADDKFGIDRYPSHRALVHALRAGNASEAEELVTKDARGGLDDLLRSPAVRNR